MSEDGIAPGITEDRRVDPDQKTFTFPLWVCVSKHLPVEQLLSGTFEGGARFIYVFKSQTAAQRHLEEFGISAIAGIVDIPGPDICIALMEDVLMQGCPFVVVHDEHSTRDTGFAVSITEFITTLRRKS